MFSISLYNMTCEKNVVDKTDGITLVSTLQGTLREQCSLTTPSITIEMENVPTFNYVYIPSFNRYYFVTNITSINQKLWRIDLDVDVLMSYKGEIKEQMALIDRCEDNGFWDVYLRDENIITDTRYSIIVDSMDINQIFTFDIPTTITDANTRYCFALSVDGDEGVPVNE